MSHRARLLLALVSTGLIGYIAVGSLLARVLGDTSYGQLAIFNEVVRLVIDSYVEPVNVDRAMAGARLGMADALDGDSSYLDAEEFRLYQQPRTESDAEVGLVLTRRFSFVMVVAARPGSPAEKAGLRPGDLLKTIDCGMTNREYAALHSLDVGANCFSLWQMADNLAAFHQKFPRCFDTMESRIGYRVRPSWVYRRKRYDRIELVIAFKNDGVAGVPGSLKVWVENRKTRMKIGGSLDPGHPYAGKLRQASFLLPEGVDYEGCTLRAEIECKGLVRPVRWACEQPANPDGTLSLVQNAFLRPGWRKDQ